MTRLVMVIGAGGHAAVVADALIEAGIRVIGFTDVDASRHGGSLADLPILGSDAVLSSYKPDSLCLANGLGFARGTGLESPRFHLQKRLEAHGWLFLPVVHPRAIVSRHAVLGAGSQVMAGAIVQAGAIIGVGTIVNTAAVVEHGSVVGNWCHLATRATLCGETRIGDGCFIGAGAVLRQGVTLGESTVAGAGAVILGNSAGSETLCGVPARPLGKKQ